MRIRNVIALIVGAAAFSGVTLHAGTPGPDGGLAELPVTAWTMTGIEQVIHPAFHDERRGGTDVEDLLSPTAPDVREGRTAVEAAADGTFRFDTDGAGVRRAALFSTLTATRFVSTELVVSSEHPVRVWLGDTSIDLDPGDEGRTGRLDLEPGEHRLTLESVRDPGEEASWWVRAVLRARDPETVTVPVVVSADRPSLLTIEEVVEGPHADGLAVSPDGGRRAIALREWDRDRERFVRWIGGSREIRSPGGPRDPSFSPRTGRLAWVTVDGDRTSIWVEGREVLPDLEDFEAYAWMPDESGLIVTATMALDPDESDEDPGIRRVRSPLDRQPSTREPTHLWKIDLPSGLRTRLTAGEHACRLGDVAPDGSWLVFLREVEDLSARPFTRSEAWRLDLETGEVDKLFEDGWLTDVAISPDGERLLAQAGPSAFGGVGRTVGEAVTPNDYDGQLYLWTLADGSVEPVTRDLAPAVIEVRWSRVDGAIYARVRDRDRVVVVRRTAADPGWKELETGIDAVDHVAVAADAPVVELAGSSPWQPLQLARYEVGSGAETVTAGVAGPLTGSVRPGRVDSWSTTVSDGTEVLGTVYLPPDFDPDRRWPALVYYYGGTSPVDRAFGGRYPKEWWATRGYVVAVLNPAGATGLGQARSAVHTDDWGRHTAGQIIEATENFLSAHSYVDPERVGCLGASYGGFMTMRIVTLSERFAAAVAHAGISALTSYWGEGYWGYSYGAVANAGQFPWNRPDVFVDRSPLFSADEVTTPLLLTHGSSDPNVPPGESIQMFTALELLGREVELLEVADQAHWILDHDQRILWSKSIVAWFDRWLKDQPEWWFHLWPEDD
jgi:dipeptidyl aminopeptidase/acylaminoacyl peptidase